MSEYQYYEFQAIDRPLDEADRAALRAMSTRARITATSFTNSYEWGDFKGDPGNLMERWFDLHLYFANWGSRRLMMRLPKRLVDRPLLDAVILENDDAKVRMAGENLILDIWREELEFDEWDEEDGDARWLGALAPLRAQVLAGDVRLFYLLWLMAVEADAFEADAPEPMAGIGPMTGALEAFADFFHLDADLVTAAAERNAVATPDAASSDTVRHIIAAMADREKTGLLERLFEGDPHVAADLRAQVRQRLPAEAGSPPVARTVGELRERARALGRLREQAAAAKAEAERQRQAEAAEKIRRARLEAVARRGESAWREVEAEIERRNAGSYDRAANLIADLQTIAGERGTTPDFAQRLLAIRARHAQKGRFLERLAKLGAPAAG